MASNMVELKNIIKDFQGHRAVDEISLDVMHGEFLTLLGPSGCGKTTTLRIIAGFEEATLGETILDGKDVSSVQPYKRNVNTVFQNYALFPHMNIFDNIAFGLKIKKTDKSQIKEKVMNALKLVQLEGYENRMPNQLSGGQKQRVAIARAIVNNPGVLLLDEPLGALDLKLRKQMQFELKHLQKKLGITFIYVTHDQEEALTMSDRIAVMNKGKIEQIGTPEEIYERPKTRFVADFIGETNILEANVREIRGNETFLDIEGDEIAVVDENLNRGEKVFIAIRPERMKISHTFEHERHVITGKIKEQIYVGSVSKTVVTLRNGKDITINETAGNVTVNPEGKDVYVSWRHDNAVVMKT